MIWQYCAIYLVNANHSVMISFDFHTSQKLVIKDFGKVSGKNSKWNSVLCSPAYLDIYLKIYTYK